MKHRKQYSLLAFLFVLQVILLQNAGCKKEYSCEGCFSTTTVDSIPIPIPIPTPPPAPGSFPQCSLCKASDELLLSRWSFKTGNSFICGVVNNAGAGIDPEKKAFTFFGPSACSNDTGLVMTVYVPVVLNRDRFNVKASRVAFYYYDNNATKDIFISLPTSAPFFLNLESFIYATGIASGTFGGIVYKPNGDTASIYDGKFKIKLKY
jgi:hypothetical protein